MLDLLILQKRSTHNKNVKKQWISKKEVHRFINVILWATRTRVLEREYHELGDRILLLWRNSGSTFTFKYLKECLNITTRKIAKIDIEPSKSIFVKLDRYGFPSIIPKEIVKSINVDVEDLGSRKLFIVGILTVLSIFRVFPTKVKESMDTITNKFSGLSRELDRVDIQSALSTLGIKIHKKWFKIKLLGSVKAGPNSHKAFLGTCLDAFALLHSPRVLWGWVRSASPLLVTWWFLIVLLGGPYFALSRAFGAQKPVNGRLSIVYNQAGKARVVAITNWWIQMNLYSLHKSIFSFLKSQTTDGTFDQIGAINNLINRVPKGQTLYGFDLSAATDRLPIDLQVQILNMLNINGRAWRDQLSIDWLYDGSFYKYQVGQPMGAYSSWAMLALTHHVIIRISAIKAGLSPDFSEYCVLGDDVVIANDFVATEYLKIMSILGVEISLGKSIVSPVFTEFAKKLLGPQLNISPIGPGLLLNTIRYRYYIVPLICDLLESGVSSIKYVSTHIQSLPTRYRKYEGILPMALFIYNLRFIKSLNPRDGDFYRYQALNVSIWASLKYLLTEMESKWQGDLKELIRSAKFSFSEGLFISQSRLGLPSLSEAMIFIISPGVYYLIISYLKNIDDLIRNYFEFSFFSKSVYRDWNKDWIAVVERILNYLDSSNIVNTNWDEKEAVKEHLRIVKGIVSQSQQAKLVLSFRGLEISYKKLFANKEKIAFYANLKGLVPLKVNHTSYVRSVGRHILESSKNRAS